MKHALWRFDLWCLGCASRCILATFGRLSARFVEIRFANRIFQKIIVVDLVSSFQSTVLGMFSNHFFPQLRDLPVLKSPGFSHKTALVALLQISPTFDSLCLYKQRLTTSLRHFRYNLFPVNIATHPHRNTLFLSEEQFAEHQSAIGNHMYRHVAVPLGMNLVRLVLGLRSSSIWPSIKE